jgi:hypothetical protein
MSYNARSARSESSNEYHCGQYGQNIDIPLCEDFLYRVGFDDASVYSKIIRVHHIIRNSWHNLHYNSFGPQPEMILKLNAFSTRLLLVKFDAPSVVAWYERLTSTCEGFQIALVPFNAIQFQRRQEGLCIPGLGFDRYDDMASALCTALPICLTKADSCVKAMVADVKMRTRDGYEVVWNLLYRFIPGFDPTKTVDKPSWDEHSGDVIHYAAAFDLYFWLSAKRDENHNQFTRLILFLKGITARNLMKIVEPLLIAMEGTQRDLNNIGGAQIGYLPHHLHVSALAQRIAERCKVKPFNRDLGGHPQVHNLTYGDDLLTPPNDSDEDASQYAEPLDGHMQGYLVPTIAQA